MQDDSSRNTIIFLVCALVLFIIYQTFVLEPATQAAPGRARQGAPGGGDRDPRSPRHAGRRGPAGGDPRGRHRRQPSRDGRHAVAHGLGLAEGRADRRPLPHPIPRDGGQELAAGGTPSPRRRRARLFRRDRLDRGQCAGPAHRPDPLDADSGQRARAGPAGGAHLCERLGPDLHPTDRDRRPLHVHRHRHGGQYGRGARDPRPLWLGATSGPAARRGRQPDRP